jgi:uncharacterized membrane protein YkoI
MRITRTRALVAAGAVAALAGTGAAIAGATGDDEDATRSIQGAALQKASAAALEHTGGGRVTDTEAGDEEGAYEVEVTRDDGSQVDVHLDSDFRVIGAAEDQDREED